MGGPAKSGYCGGKLLPKEKDLIKGIVAAKSLHTFVAILRLPDGVILKVFHISHQEKMKRIAKNNSSFPLFLLITAILTKVYQTAKAVTGLEEAIPKEGVSQFLFR